MLFFSAFAPTPWRTLRMRGRRADCIACGTPACATDAITRERVESGALDYVGFCGGAATATGAPLDARHRRSVAEARAAGALVVDVRDPVQFGICNVPGSVNVPFDEFQRVAGMVDGRGCAVLPESLVRVLEGADGRDLALVCRLGNDSQLAARQVLESEVWKGQVYDVRGGIREWAKVAPEDGVVEY